MFIFGGCNSLRILIMYQKLPCLRILGFFSSSCSRKIHHPWRPLSLPQKPHGRIIPFNKSTGIFDWDSKSPVQLEHWIGVQPRPPPHGLVTLQLPLFDHLNFHGVPCRFPPTGAPTDSLVSPKVMTMSEGEESRFFIAPDLAYGDSVVCWWCCCWWWWWWWLQLLFVIVVVSLTLTQVVNLLFGCDRFLFKLMLFGIDHFLAEDLSPCSLSLHQCTGITLVTVFL